MLAKGISIGFAVVSQDKSAPICLECIYAWFDSRSDVIAFSFCGDI